MDRKTITGRDPLTGEVLRIEVRGAVVTSVEPFASDDEDSWLTHGLIDLQVNGYRGYDLNSEGLTTDTVSALTRELLHVGVTSYAPTLVTGPLQRTLHGLQTIAVARIQDALSAAAIPFIHMEGPAISPLDGYRGAHPLADVRAPSLAEFERWQQASGNLVGMVTLSPHWPDASTYIATLTARGIRVALGHTHASQEQVRLAVNAGATLSTHLGNAVPQLLARHPNSIWSQLAEDRLTAGFIADGFHLPGEALRAMIRAKGIQHCFLVSDSVALAGCPPGRYRTAVGDMVDVASDGQLTQSVSGLLAGSAVPLIECIGRCMQLTGSDLPSVLGMATETPGRIVGADGRLEPGARADILRFQWMPGSSKLVPKEVWLRGVPVATS